MEEIVVCTWGISPSYRRRIKLHIQKAIDTGYNNIMPYIILTDDPSDFYELQDKTKKIIDIVDIHATREKYSPWSIDYEYISKEKTEESYSRDIINHNAVGKWFSYGLHRFYLPRVSELGYNRFIHCDSDHDIRYDKIINGTMTENNFWEEFNTPVNTMKGIGLTTYTAKENGSWASAMINFTNIFRYEMMNRHPEYKYQLDLIFDKFEFTEGPLRYYHMKSSENVLKYFLIWDEIAKINLTNHELSKHSGGASGMFLDYAMWVVANEILKIKIMNFPQTSIAQGSFWSDRYFAPTALGITKPDGEFLAIKPAHSKKEFLEINKELFDLLMATGWYYDQYVD